MTSTESIEIPHSLRVGEIFTLIFSFVFTTISVYVRLYTKIRLTHDVRLEDYLSFLSWLSFMAFLGLCIKITNNHGEAVHTAYLTAIANTMYTIIIAIVKVSILYLYMTIFVPHKRGSFYYVIHLLIWSNVIYYFITTVFYMNECTPRAKVWNPAIPGHCISRYQTTTASGVLNVLSDFSILILPIQRVWRLQMSNDKKIYITGVFSVGLLACVISIVRLIYSVGLLHERPGTPTFQLNEDKLGILSFAEIALGIIVGCLPIIPRFFRQVSFQRLNPSIKLRWLFSNSNNDARSGVSRSWLRFLSRIRRSGSESEEVEMRTPRPLRREAPRISTIRFPTKSGFSFGSRFQTESEIELHLPIQSPPAVPSKDPGQPRGFSSTGPKRSTRFTVEGYDRDHESLDDEKGRRDKFDYDERLVLPPQPAYSR